VAGIDVHDDVGQVERLEGIGDAIAVTAGRVLAGAQIGVGDQVRQGIGLDDKSEGCVRVRLEDLGDSYDRPSVAINFDGTLVNPSR
jgi:hypothetical protein